MLTLSESATRPTCDHIPRRDFLKIGGLTLGGVGLSDLLSKRAAAQESRSFFKNKSVVLLFLCGGASHIETFDPKPDAPSEFRSCTGAIRTAIPGVEFGGTFPGLAQRADRLSIVRNFAPHGIADHAMAIKHVLTAGSPEQTSVGSRYARYRGTSHEQTGMPTYATLIEPNEPDPQYVEDRDRMRIGSAPGDLGLRYAGFDPGSGGKLASDMKLHLPRQRFSDRLSLLDSLDSARRLQDRSEVMEALGDFQRQAVEVVLGGDVRNALDLTREPAAVREAYSTRMFDVGWTQKRPSTLGERLLMARRLCQAGAGFVTVGSAGWDNHANGKHPTVYDGMHLLGNPLDKAVSAFLDDVQRLGLEDEILLVITSEFGRTPKLESSGGRDHWPGLDMLVFAGGGLNHGQVIGESTKKAEEPQGERSGYGHLLGSIWETLFDLGELRLQPAVPRELLAELETLTPIPELF